MHPVTAPPNARRGTGVAAPWWLPARDEDERATDGPPPWAAYVERALAAAPARPPAPAPRPAQDLAGLLAPPLAPLLAAADAAFAAAAPAARDADARAVWAGTRRWLAAQLATAGARTLVGHVHKARAAGELTGATPTDRFDEALRALATRPALTELLAGHPVLGRLWGGRCLTAVDVAVELLGRWRADRAALAATLLAGDAVPGAPTRVRLGLGDPHAGGRTVALLEFADGRRLVHKPRPLGAHARWNELLEWFARRRPDLAPRAVELLPRDGYGWAGFVAPAPCAHEAEVAAFYARTGAQLALLQAVRAVDIHAENVIAAGGHPVVVDVETLFHPSAPPLTDGGPDPAADALAESAHRTAVLPQPLLGEAGAIDSSAVGAHAGQLTPGHLPTWEDAGTDRMRLVRGRLPWPGGPNRPTLPPPHAPPVPADHAGALRDGFRAAHRLLSAHAAELTAEDGPLIRFAEERTRLVVRPSQEYADLLAEATAPEALRTLAARRRAFAALHEDTGRPRPAALADHELAELLDGDIPLLTTTPGSADVRTATGRTVPDVLPGPGLAAAVAALRGWDETERGFQDWVVRASLATTRPFAGHRADPGTPPVPPGTAVGAPPGAEWASALAENVGDRLLALARTDGARVNWAGLHLLGARRWFLHPQGAALADGYPGTALFLAELGRATGRDRYLTAAADAVTRPLPATLRLLAAHPELADAVGPGGFHGVGGLAYATARLARLLDSEELTAALPDARTALASAAARADTADLADGLAGALLGAEALRARGTPGAAALAAALTARLERATPPAAPGLLRGSAGVDLALGRPTAAAPPAADLGWCAGLAGTLLAGGSAAARAAHRERLADRAPGPDHSLCHGELGLLEPLVADTRGEGPPAHPAVTRLLHAIEREGPRCGTPDGVPTPGLLNGLAGIGHGLLRLALGPEVPSVLRLRAGDGEGVPSRTGDRPGARRGTRHHDRATETRTTEGA
ncbi:type 2 lantibiotic biosynthesis protein LanM [Streptomyces zhaozhouensis]|uniref:Type 2 lantibiotic biosynthesis protein LanM n=1 Tax=Streptomyces zhaozhouensis TaxID=1300267 RepID=A0A286DUI9_9ACTN|nr:type 2 lanthipeptide synthetase LanM family protein [Streptomyces zhaozhouensis]SOD62273.1 type 2 lantibiotic biosynthesis protein LanM [Streptomyces zhaozhouensis]